STPRKPQLTGPTNAAVDHYRSNPQRRARKPQPRRHFASTAVHHPKVAFTTSVISGNLNSN
ncbi:hypothetical protein, partial [Lacticaseibacillus pantheris]|uniref:hypothetical protein n=1 Tax=Lacticaseibacillus pantheris TaxID=171523 RepID=UPI001CDB11DA